MATITSTLTTLLPIILGGLIGFLASFVTSHFGHSRAQKTLTEERTRERLEDLYKTLIQVSRMSSEHYGQAISHVHFAEKIEQRTIDEFPPHAKLEMLVGLYFKDFKSLHKNFANAQEKFSMKYVEIVTKNFSSESSNEKKSVCTDLTKLDIALEKTIKEMRVRISEEIKI
jgi:hypothetical protein